MAILDVIRLDRYLSNFATKYNVQERCADFIAPPFRVARIRDKYVQYTKNSLRVYDTAVGRQEVAKTIDMDVVDGTYVTQFHALNQFIDLYDQSNVDAGIVIDKVKTGLALDAFRLAREYRVLKIVTDPTLVTQTATPSTKWDVAGGTPIADILNAMAVIKKNSTKTPNRIVMSLETALKMVQTTEWKDYFKYSAPGFGQGLFSAVDGLKNLGLQPQIAGAYGVTTAPGVASDPQIEAMLGTACVLWYGEDTPSLESRTFMYSPFIQNEEIWRIESQREHGRYIEVRSHIAELLVDAQCAYLFTAVRT